jgi:hypothetical protein
MTPVAQADLPDSGASGMASPVLPVGAAVEPAPVGRSKHEFLHLPLSPGDLTLHVLCLAMKAKAVDDCAGQSERFAY